MDEALHSHYQLLRWPLNPSHLLEQSKALAEALGCKPFFGVKADSCSFSNLDSLDLHLPFDRITQLHQLIESSKRFCTGTPRLRCWDGNKQDRLFEENTDHFERTDIMLKTRVLAFHFESAEQPKPAIRVATATNLQPHFVPFAKDFGRVFVFSGQTVAEVIPWAKGTKEITDSRASIEESISPRTEHIVNLNKIIGGPKNVAFIFVWRVFEELPRAICAS